MSFDTGSLSYLRYAVVGQAPVTPDEAMLDKLRANALVMSDMGLPADVEYGWSGPRHVRDADFSFGHCVFNDCLFVALRIDTNKVPAEMKHAWTQQEEEAVAKTNPSGFISKQQKRQVKDSIERKVDEELRSGRYRRSKLVPILWDVPAGVLYGPASVAAAEKLTELFSRTFELELHPLTSGNIGIRELERLGKRREYEDLVPTRFALSPEDAAAPAEYPWTVKGDGAKDFLGNEFLLWLWHAATERSGAIPTSAGDAMLLFDRTLSLDCVYNHTGKETITATGPTRLPEAIDALRTGKAPRKAGLVLDWRRDQYAFTITGETLSIGGLKLPAVEKADTPRTLFEERITHLRDFNKGVDALFGAFLSARVSGWAETVAEIQAWIASHVRPVAAPPTAEGGRLKGLEHFVNAVEVRQKMLDKRERFKRFAGDGYADLVALATSDIRAEAERANEEIIPCGMRMANAALEEKGDLRKQECYVAALVEMFEPSTPSLVTRNS